MPLSSDPKKAYPSTYIMRSNEEELQRLQAFDQALTTGMGGVLAEQEQPERFATVLDVGCGTGGWLIEAAKTYPTMKQLVGVDSSSVMIEYARAQAKEAQVSDRVEFLLMDALRVLEFPAQSFDLVNHRSAMSWLRTWDWPKLLQEYQRVCKQDEGVIRVTEPDFQVSGHSDALMWLISLVKEAFYRGGYQFTEEVGIAHHLASLMHQHGLQAVQQRQYVLEFQAGTDAWNVLFAHNIIAFRTLLPFLNKRTRVPDEYEARYQQMLLDMQLPEFTASWDLVTAWGHPS